MTTYAALLRGINLGTHNRLPMRTLREILADLGGSDVRTLLQSGNALFAHDAADPAELASALRTRIAEELALTVPCVVRPAADLGRVIRDNPFTGVDVDPSKLLVTFLSGPVDASLLSGLDPASFAPDEFRLGVHEIYVHCPRGVRGSRLAQGMWEKRLGLTATSRNWNTVTKLAGMTTT